jgi:hypothetical protein
MPLTEEKVGEQVYNLLRLQRASVDATTVPRVMGLIPTGLSALAKRVAEGPGWRALLKDFTGVVTNGYVDLTLSAWDGMLLDLNRATFNVTPSGDSAGYYQPLPNERVIESTRLPSEFGYVSRLQNQLKVRRKGQTTWVVFSGAITVTANFIPALAELPGELEQDLILMLAELVGGPAFVETKDSAERGARRGQVK